MNLHSKVPLFHTNAPTAVYCVSLKLAVNEEDTEGKRCSVKIFKIQRRPFYYCKVTKDMLEFQNFKVDYKIRVDLGTLWSLWVSISPKFVFLALPTICSPTVEK